MLDPFGGPIYTQPNWDVKVEDAISVLVSLGRVDEPISIILNNLLQGLDGVLELSDFFLPGLFALEHGLGQSLGQGMEGVMVNGRMCCHDGKGRVRGVGMHLGDREGGRCDGHHGWWDSEGCIGDQGFHREVGRGESQHEEEASDGLIVLEVGWSLLASVVE
jgi:hypothetical protein